MKVGDHVEWTSQAGGFKKVKRGCIVAIVPPGVSLRRVFLAQKWSFTGGQYDCSVLDLVTYNDRIVESFLVAVAPPKGSKRRVKLYWPRVASLKIVEVEVG